MTWHGGASHVPARGRAPGTGTRPGLAAESLADRGAVLVARPLRRVFPGQLRQVAHVRRFVARALAGCPAVDSAVLLASELAANALAHTASSGGAFEVIVWRGAAAACIAVLDSGSAGAPAPASADVSSESGRGLRLVSLLSDRWGHEGSTAGRATWFLLRWPSPRG